MTMTSIDVFGTRGTAHNLRAELPTGYRRATAKLTPAGFVCEVHTYVDSPHGKVVFTEKDLETKGFIDVLCSAIAESGFSSISITVTADKCVWSLGGETLAERPEEIQCH